MMQKTDRQILALALPSIVQNVTVPLLGLCDVTIMGHVGGAESIGAIAVGSMVFNVVYWLFGFLRMATSGLTAQAFGGGRMDLSMACLRQGLLVGLGAGLLFVLLQVPLRSVALWAMQTPAEVQPLVTTYYNICVWGAPAVLALYALTGWFIGMQDTRTPMLIAVGQNVLNIGLSLTFVVAFDMGVGGVALGTLIAQWAGLGGALVLFATRSRRHGLALSHLWRGHATFVLRHLTIYGDIFLRTVCLVAVNLYFTSSGAAQGSLVLAANTLLMQFFMFYSYIMDGFAFAGEALAGRYLGAGDQPTLRLTIVRLFRWGWGMALLFSLVYALAGTPLLRLLTSHADVVAAATAYLPWAVLVPLAGTAAFVWDGIFIGTTRSRGMLVACFWAALAFFTLWFALAPLLANHALWIALLVYLAVRGIVQTWLWNRSNVNTTDANNNSSYNFK